MTASVTAEITKTRNSIEDILAEDSSSENMLSEAEMKNMIKGLVTEARRGGKVGMFKMAAAAIGGAAAFKLLASMFGPPPMDYYDQTHDPVTGLEIIRPHGSDFGKGAMYDQNSPHYNPDAISANPRQDF